jgi:hypothetical protein
MRRHILAVALSCVAVQPTVAAIGEAAPAECVTIASDLRSIRETGAPIEVTVFQGIAARHALAVIAELGAPEQETWGKAVAVMLMIGGPDANPPVLFKFFGADGCAFTALATDQKGAAAFLEKLGATI